MDTATHTAKPLRRTPARDLPAIDYVRGIAALGVVLFHARVTLWVGWREIQAHPENFSAFDRALAWLSAPTPFLGTFVMLFFVVSGFCVHLPQSGPTAPLPLRAYFARRFFRIYPPYLGAVALSAAILPGWQGEPVGASAAMVQNYLPGAQLSTNPALWSLPVELELYLVYPLVWWLARRGGWGLALAATGIVSLVAAGFAFAGRGMVEGNFALYWIIWCAGAWLAEAWSRGQLAPPPGWCGLVALAGLAAGIFAIVRQHSGGATHLAWGLFFFWAVWLLVTHPEWGRRLPRALDALLRWLGRISYSLYLIHFPLLILLGGWWVKVAGGKPHSFLVPLLASAALLPAAWLFYRACERPSHQLAKRLAQSDAP